MPRGKSTKKQPKKREFSNPRSEFVYSPVPVTLKELSETWKGVKGCTHQWLIKKARKGKWKHYRNEYQTRVRVEAEKRMVTQQSDELAMMREDATKRHAQAAREGLQVGTAFVKAAAQRLVNKVVCKNCGEVVKLPKEDIKSTDAGRTGSRMTKDAIDGERKALGIAEKIELQSHTEEIVTFVFELMEKHVIDIDIFKAMSDDLALFAVERRKRTEAEVGQVLDAKLIQTK